MDKQNSEPRIFLARNIAKEILKNIGVKNPPILIKDVLNHIKKEKDLLVYPWFFDDSISGIQITKGEEAIIGYNKSQHPHRQRFTIAHEIGHFLLGHTQKNFILDFDSRKPEEIEANQFAAELLIPLEMLKKDLKSNKKPKDIAREYNVSEEALWWRIYESKLIFKVKK